MSFPIETPWPKLAQPSTDERRRSLRDCPASQSKGAPVARMEWIHRVWREAHPITSCNGKTAPRPAWVLAALPKRGVQRCTNSSSTSRAVCDQCRLSSLWPNTGSVLRGTWNVLNAMLRRILRTGGAGCKTIRARTSLQESWEAGVTFEISSPSLRRTRPERNLPRSIQERA